MLTLPWPSVKALLSALVWVFESPWALVLWLGLAVVLALALL